jgi:predicted ATPase
VDELHKLLRDPQCRMLTLVGPGGIGKTRLAMESASQCQNDFSDGVYFVPLASITSSRFIVPVIADSIGYTFQGKSALDPKVQLLNHLNKRQVMLLVDNLEHLLGEADVVELFAELLECTDQVKLLVTSRESVGLQGEWVFEVHGLRVPDGTQMEGTSVELFLQRARRAHAGFDATTADYPAILRICQLVDGMPLGIELAAAWVRTLTCDEIADEIERGLDFLSLSAKDLPARHRSMRAVFDHSWKLLSEEEQNVLMRLSVFEGGFTREAAQQVANATLSILSALITKSLIRRSGTGRYDMHEVIRQFSWQRLVDLGKQEEISNRHFGFFLELAEESRPKLRGAEQNTWLHLIETNYDNMRTALEWSLRFEGVAGEISPEQEKAVQGAIQLAGALYIFWAVRNYWSEGRKWLQRVLAQPAKMQANHQRFRALNSAVGLALEQADFREALELTEQNLSIATQLADPILLAYAHRARGTVFWQLKEHDAANDQCEKALHLFRTFQNRLAPDDVVQLARSLQTLGRIAISRNNLTLAKPYLEEAAEIFQQAGNISDYYAALSDLGLLAYLQYDMLTARTYQEKSLSVFRETGFIADLEMALNRLGDVTRYENNYEEALALYTEAITIYREDGGKDGIASLAHNLGCVASVCGNYSKAMSHFKEGLQIQAELNNYGGIAECLAGIGSVLLSTGQTERAARLFGSAEALRERVGAVLWPANQVEYNNNLARMNMVMDKGMLEKAWEEGKTMSVEQAVIEASRSSEYLRDQSTLSQP